MAILKAFLSSKAVYPLVKITDKDLPYPADKCILKIRDYSFPDDWTEEQKTEYIERSELLDSMKITMKEYVVPLDKVDDFS